MMDDQEMPDDKTLGGAGRRNLVFTRVFDAPVDRVWKVWTDPEQVKCWWGPDGFSCPFARINFREGGISLVCMRAPKEFMGAQETYTAPGPTRKSCRCSCIWRRSEELVRSPLYAFTDPEKSGKEVSNEFEC